MSRHERYGDICVDCSRRAGFHISWNNAQAVRHNLRAFLAPPSVPADPTETEPEEGQQ